MIFHDVSSLAEVMYVTQLPQENWQGIGWVFLNSIIAVVDRLLQRLLLSKETGETVETGGPGADGTLGGWEAEICLLSIIGCDLFYFVLPSKIGIHIWIYRPTMWRIFCWVSLKSGIPSKWQP